VEPDILGAAYAARTLQLTPDAPVRRQALATVDSWLKGLSR
jgi:hypothetical protein